MSKSSEFEYKIKKTTERYSTLRTIAGYACLTYVAYLMVTAFRDVAINSPDQIVNLAKVVQAISIHKWLPWVVASVTTAAWRIERNGKKRAIKAKSSLQKKLEQGDPNRSSSGLTETGDTPEDE